MYRKDELEEFDCRNTLSLARGPDPEGGGESGMQFCPCVNSKVGFELALGGVLQSPIWS